MAISTASRQKGRTQGASAGATWNPSGKRALRHALVYFRYRAPKFDASFLSQYSELYHSLAGGRRSGGLHGIGSREEGACAFCTFGKFSAPVPPSHPPPNKAPTQRQKWKIRTFRKSRFVDPHRGKRKTEVSRRLGRGYIVRNAPQFTYVWYIRRPETPMPPSGSFGIRARVRNYTA